MVIKSLGMSLGIVVFAIFRNATNILKSIYLSVCYASFDALGTVLGTKNTISLLYKLLPFPEFIHSRECSQKIRRNNCLNPLYLLNCMKLLRSQLPKTIPNLNRLITKGYCLLFSFPNYTPYYVRGYISDTPYISSKNNTRTRRLQND